MGTRASGDAGLEQGVIAVGEAPRAVDLADSDDTSFRALGLILAAWDEGAENGVAPEQMAYAALFTALSDLVALYGEEAVMKLARGLVRRVEHGEFTLDRTLQ
jgi:hypothetical protein